MSNPYVFIVGCPRSGTTLLRHILSAHSQLVITSEQLWIPAWYEKRVGLTPDGMVTPDLIHELLTNHKYARKFSKFRLGSEKLESLIGGERPVPYSSFVTSIFDMYGKAQGKKLVGNKSPDLVRRLGTLHELWPRTRFIHLIRDGRDVTLSLMNWPKIVNKKPGTFTTWEEDPVSTAALWWELNVRRGRDSRQHLGPDLYKEVRYESLVTDTERECKSLCRFLDLEYEGTMLHWNEQGEPNKELGSLRKDASGKNMPTTPGLRNWRIQMPPEDVERFEATAGALLDTLGYPRAFPDPAPDVLRHSSQIRKLLATVPEDIRPYQN